MPGEEQLRGIEGPFDPFPMEQNGMHCGSLPLESLARRFGTPLYVYSLDSIRDRYRQVESAFASARLLIAYSVKANGNLGILSGLAGLGAGADIVSGGELFRALRGGIPPKRIVFAGVGKTDDELRAGLDAGILSFHVETIEELHRLDALAEERQDQAPFGIRINPDIQAPTPHAYTRTGHAETKFGLAVAEAIELYRWASSRPHLRAMGIDVHIGSQIVDPAPYVRALRSALEVVQSLRDEGVALNYVDLGGGFGIPYESEGMDLLALSQALLPLLEGRGLKLILEPGRYLVGESGVLLTRVQAVKRAGAKIFVITDAGMTDLLRPSHYGGYHAVQPVMDDGARPVEVVDVVGPICESGDFLARDRPLRMPVAGDLLAVRDVGAYGFSMASNYNARPRPAEVMVDGEEVHLVRRRERLEDLVRGETIPPSLRTE